MTILVVDDDPEVRNLVAWQLEAEGFDVELAADARSALGALGRPGLQLLVVDLSLPDMSGLDIIRQVRHLGNLPIIVLSARSQEEDRIRGLEFGADDYVTKPFSPRELALRVSSLLRRVEGDATELLKFGPLRIDGASRRVHVHGNEVTLTAMEFDLLHFLARSAGRAYTREQLLRHVWQSSSTWQSAATVTQHVHRLRNKLEIEPREPKCLLTMPGGRYLFERDGLQEPV